jgi:hypothetical protein
MIARQSDFDPHVNSRGQTFLSASLISSCMNGLGPFFVCVYPQQQFHFAGSEKIPILAGFSVTTLTL